MMERNLAYGALLFLAAAISAGLAALSWRRRTVPGATPAILYYIATAWWAMASALHWSGAARLYPFFWQDLTYLGAVTVPTFFWFFVLRYTSSKLWLNRIIVVLLLIEPIVTIILLFTEARHGLFFAGQGPTPPGLPPSGPGGRLGGGPWFWTNTIYQYILSLISAVFLGVAYWRAPSSFYRKQALILLLGVMISWIPHILRYTRSLPAPNLDLMPLAYTVMGIFLAVGLYRYRFLDIRPVARETLIEYMGDGVLVLDQLNRIVDINPAGQQLIGQAAAALIGRDADVLRAIWPTLQLYPGSPDAQDAVPSARDASQYLDVRLINLARREGENSGRLVILRDISARKRLEQEREQLIQTLQDALSQVKTLHGLLPICASCKKIRDDGGYWQQLEVYISSHSEADFTHGICPDCMKKLYPEYVDQ